MKAVVRTGTESIEPLCTHSSRRNNGMNREPNTYQDLTELHYANRPPSASWGVEFSRRLFQR